MSPSYRPILRVFKEISKFISRVTYLQIIFIIAKNRTILSRLSRVCVSFSTGNLRLFVRSQN